MFRSAILVILGTSITAFISFFVVVSYRLFPRGEYTTHRVSVLWAQIMLRLSSVKANHQSGFDILIVLANIETYFAWIAKKELFAIPVFGRALARTGSIPIDRKNFIRAMRSIDDAARRIREGKSVMTFPEGTRSMDGQIHPFKKGVFHLALKAGVPIVPVTIVGSGGIMPKKSLRVHPGHVTLVIDRPIDVTAYTEETLDDLLNRVHDVIASHYYLRRPESTLGKEKAA
jgi:1-acyl-sn-glycerol-3-phosphate acyltransferase